MKKCLFFIAISAIFLRIMVADPYSIFFKGKKFRSPPQLDQYNYNALSYTINLNVDFQNELIYGSNKIEILIQEANTDSLYIDFANEMIIDSIFGEYNHYIHEDNKIKIYLDSSYTNPETVTIIVFYHGDPSSVSDSGLSFAFHNNSEIVSTLSEPTGAKSWFPLKDVPFDKVFSQMSITVPDTLIAVSNGVLDSVRYKSNKATFYWREQYPIAPYLISFAVTNYSNFVNMYHFDDGDSMPIIYYVYPEDYVNARTDFSNVPYMLDFYNSYFGKYPFGTEKYGMAEFTWRPSMEHQTLTSISYRMITGNHDYDYVFAHELAHQWWGDLVTCAEWKDIWLNEGFATYSDAMYHQYMFGDSVFQKRMSDFKHYYFIDDSSARYSIYDPLYMWRATVYEKGAWVLNMLRGIVGDSTFQEILLNYRGKYAYSSATSDDFIEVCDSTFGSNLSWFFDEWLYRAGYPEYIISYISQRNSNGGFDTKISLSQVQDTSYNTPDVFKMPVKFKLLSSATDTSFCFIDSLKNDTFSVTTDDSITNVIFDPDSIILKKLQYFPWGIKVNDKLHDGRNIYLKYGSDCIYVSGIKKQGKYTFQITDIAGRRILSGEIINNKIFTNKLNQGIYFMTLMGDKLNNIFKIIVVK